MPVAVYSGKKPSNAELCPTDDGEHADVEGVDAAYWYPEPLRGGVHGCVAKTL